ncbi:ribonuclease E [Arthrobacter woluwensis]|uniref:ribonuclease E/G n=1 Tax=Arthrobacter woluwensis TaxID=156980 RepID=UPI00278ADFAC|nr:ribonuclease E/G [Arthrobacter woluwensis]MDQ0709033.1 ribonuclease E [Arthrobacter woluwensis]
MDSENLPAGEATNAEQNSTEAVKKPARSRRRIASAPAGAPAPVTEAPAAAAPAAESAGEAPAKTTTRRRPSRAKAAAAEETAPAAPVAETAAVSTEAPAAAAPAKAPARKRAPRKATAPTSSPEPRAEAESAPAPVESPASESPAAEAPAAKTSSRKAPTRRRKATDTAAQLTASTEEAAPAAVAETAAADVPAQEAKAQDSKSEGTRSSRGRQQADRSKGARTEGGRSQNPRSRNSRAQGAASTGADRAANHVADRRTAAPVSEETTAPVRRRRASKYRAAPQAVEAEAMENVVPEAVVAETVESVQAPETADAVLIVAAEPAAAEEKPEEKPEEKAGDTAAEKPAEPAAENSADAAAEETAEETSSVSSLFLAPADVTSVLFHAPDLSVAFPEDEEAEDAADDEDEDDSAEGAGSRSRRRRRGRSRGRSGEGAQEASPAEDDAEESDGVTSRRRRRRRRGDQDLELTGGLDDDPPNTVTRVRAPRTPSESVSNKVTSVKGSTRLEAKKQRRRESRESGRRRQVITEAEFLARRESVDRQMVVRQKDDRIQIAVLEDGVLAEHFVSKTQQDSLIGNVYLGKVQNVLPSMEAAFVDIGRGRNAVLYAGEVNWDSVSLEGKPRRIENALKSGDSVLVQVSKDPIGHKGARLTSQISLPGRYLVYVPGGSMTGISRKLPDVERNRLKRILKDRLPENAGVIVRTAAEGASEEELTNDINRLRALWESIEAQTGSTKVLAPELLYGEPDLTIKVVRDVFNEDFSKLIVSGEEAWDTIEAYVTYVAPDLVGRLEKWTDEKDIFSAWRIDEQIHKALDRKVFLPSGGSLVIDRTEAMTVVDVNTGKFTGSGGNLEETVTKNNLEAAEEVVRQLRLRDIGGIIVIDFIDMVLESNRDLVLRRLVECLGRDRTKHQVAEVTSLGLVQMTRKRMGTGLLEVFGEQCEHCAGRGVITHDEPLDTRRPTGHFEHQHGVRPETPQQPSGRSERKRRRGRSNAAATEETPAPQQAPEHDDEDKAAKAAATRAVLANIAAAAHAAHSHDGEPDHEGTEDDQTDRPAAVLTIGGEVVELPLGQVEEPVQEPAPVLSLDALAAAFDSIGGPSAPTAAAAPVQESAAEQTAPAEAREEKAPEAKRPARRPRASRRAQSAVGASDVQQVEVTAAQESGSVRRASVQAEQSRDKGPSGEEPLVLGVGVPASEL